MVLMTFFFSSGGLRETGPQPPPAEALATKTTTQIATREATADFKHQKEGEVEQHCNKRSNS